MAAYDIDDDVPIPDGIGTRSPGEMGRDRLTIKSLGDGQSFFIPAPEPGGQEAARKRISVKSVQMRKAGDIDFFLITRRTEEEYPRESGERIKGIRVWRRATDIED
jgi:hypothetical protein